MPFAARRGTSTGPPTSGTSTTNSEAESSRLGDGQPRSLHPFERPHPLAGPFFVSRRALRGGREVRLANPRGEYDDAHRATVFAGESGEYRFESNVPVSYGSRPPHIHVRVRAPGFEELVTQHYLERGQRKANFDLVLVAE
jgi:hypothetical protein